MKKIETPCPECRYPMDKILIKKGGVHIRRIEKLICDSCNHSELVRSGKEVNSDLNN